MNNMILTDDIKIVPHSVPWYEITIATIMYMFPLQDPNNKKRLQNLEHNYIHTLLWKLCFNTFLASRLSEHPD